MEITCQGPHNVLNVPRTGQRDVCASCKGFYKNTHSIEERRPYTGEFRLHNHRKDI